MLTCPCNVDRLTPHFCIIKTGFTGVYIIFLFLLLNIIIMWVLTIDILSKRIEKIITFFHLKIIIYTAIKMGSMLYRRVIVMSLYRVLVVLWLLWPAFHFHLIPLVVRFS